jgi:hemolysin-activating ACP:hemolysin acyltransferase
VIKQLKKSYLPNYQKGQMGIFHLTKDKLPIAFKNSTTLNDEQKHHGNENPYTAVGDLVKILMELNE